MTSTLVVVALAGAAGAVAAELLPPPPRWLMLVGLVGVTYIVWKDKA